MSTQFHLRAASALLDWAEAQCGCVAGGYILAEHLLKTAEDRGDLPSTRPRLGSHRCVAWLSGCGEPAGNYLKARRSLVSHHFHTCGLPKEGRQRVPNRLISFTIGYARFGLGLSVRGAIKP
jgi:hypothetical protein